MERDIVIYNDEGVGEFGLQALQKFFKDDEVWLCNADAVIDGRILEMADIFVMPGGADLPYCKKLNGQGNDNIRNFVETGGTYLGICAGAYYACREIEFHKGRDDEICGPRELAFVDGIAIGSLPELAPYYDLTLGSAAVVPLTMADGEKLHSFYHGGPYFKMDSLEDVEILAHYDLPFAAPAIIRTKIGEGSVLLSGVHFECSPEDMAMHPTETSQEVQIAKTLAAQLNHTDWKSLLF